MDPSRISLNIQEFQTWLKYHLTLDKYRKPEQRRIPERFSDLALWEEPQLWMDEQIEFYLLNASCNSAAMSYASDKEIKEFTPQYVAAFRKNPNSKAHYMYPEYCDPKYAYDGYLFIMT